MEILKCESETKTSPSAWDVVTIARHPQRPQARDYIQSLFDEVDYIQGDRAYGEDPALLSGWADFMGEPIVFLGQQKGRNLSERMQHNSGMMHPEGYRKAHRLALMAEKFEVPLITFIDTPGAYPGIEAEKRGQSQAIAENLKLFSRLQTPILCIVIGEGCSGGALGIGVGDRFLMQQYSYFSTISPEGCAAILFKSAQKASQAAQSMGITSKILMEHNIIDKIVLEPTGGAHLDWPQAMHFMRQAIQEELGSLRLLSKQQLLEKRYDKLMRQGSYALP